MPYPSFFHMPQALSILSKDLSIPTLIIELVICCLLLVAFFMFRHRMVKLLCLFSAELCLWLACRETFGKAALISQIMNWVTAAAVLGVAIAIVSSINWGSLRGDNKKR